MAGPNTLSGNYGLIGTDEYLRKIELSCVPEASGRSQLHDYYRQELRDTRPVAPFFESEQLRGGIDPVTGEARGGYQSRGNLSLRYHGKRRQTTPWLPEGTFLDFEGTHPDPRSIMPGPDMLEYRKQEEARAKFYNYRSDEDFSIPEMGITPYRMVQNIKHALPQVKERLKIFSTSKSGFHTGSGLQRPTMTIPTGKCLTTHCPPTIADFTLRNRRNKTTSLSDDTSIGWRRGVDHEFKVSQYGRHVEPMKYQNQNWYKNRGNARTAHETFRQIEGRPVPRATAMMIVDISNLKQEMHESAQTVLGESWEGLNRKTRQMIANDIMKNIWGSHETRSVDPHTSLVGEMGGRSSKKEREYEDKKAKMVINPTVVEMMMLTNRQMMPNERDDLREEIEQSASDQGIYVEAENKSSMDQLGDPGEARYNSTYDFERGEERQVAQYSHGLLPTGSKMAGHAFEIFGGTSNEHNQRSRQNKFKIQQAGGTGQDMDMGRERTVTKTIGGLGTKYTRRFQTDTREHLDVNDR